MKKKLLYLLILSVVFIGKSNAQTALDFNGSSSETALLTDMPTFSNNFTYEAWVNPTATHEIDTQANSGITGTLGQNYLIFASHRLGDGGVGISVGTNGVSVYEHGDGYMPALLVWPGTINAWTHIAVVYTAKQPTLYVNGTLVATGLTSLRANVYPSLEGIGGGGYGYYTGKVDDFRLWNVSRTQSEIQSSMGTCLTGSEANLYALYDFEDGTGSTTLTDLTSNSNHGTLTNMDPDTDWVTGVSCTVAPCLIDQTVTAATTSFMCSGSTTIDVASSETGVNYYLRDNADDSIITGPIAGTGSAISLNTGTISASTTYNVYAEDADSSGALFFEEDPTNKYVQLATDPMSGATSLTVEMWIKPNINAGSNTGYVPLFGHDSGANRSYISSDGSIAWKADNGSTFLVSEPGVFTFDGNWHHLAIVYDETLPSGSRNIIYLDGISLALNLNNDFGGWNAPVPLRIGNSWFSQDYNYDGEMDEFRVWSIARSQVEIQSNMDAVAPSSTGLLAYYNFEDGTGSSMLTDISGNGHTGTLVNHNVNADWTTKTSVNCSLEMTVTPTVTINSITDETPTAAQSSFMCSGSTSIDLASSETGVNYYLRDDADNSIIAGPIVGTGSAISFNTGTISVSTTYNVNTEKLGSLGAPIVYDFNTSGLPVELTSTGPNTWGAAQVGSGGLTGQQTLQLQGASNDSHRTHLKTIATDFINKDFTVEILHNQGGGVPNGIFFLGIGDPGTGGSEPTNGIFTRLHPGGWENADGVVNRHPATSINETLFGQMGPGNAFYKIKMIKAGNIIQYFIDVNNTGTYVQYGSDIDVSTANFDYLDATNSSIYIGTGSSLSHFDDLTISSSVVTCSLEMTVTPTVTINAVDASTNRVDDVITATNAAATSYQWVDCDNANAAIPTETNQSFTATAIGNYAVEVTQNGCTVTSACVNIATLGILDDVFSAGIKFYPNPTTGNFTLSFKENIGEITVTIVDVLGKEVYALQKVNDQSVKLDVSHFNNGVYFVRIQNNESQKVIRLIKQ